MSAAEEAQKFLTKEIRKGSPLNPLNWGRKFGLHILEKYWRQVAARQITNSALESNNPYVKLDTEKSSILFMDLLRGRIKQLNIDVESRRNEGVAEELAETQRIQGGVRTQGGESKEEAPEKFRDGIMNEVIRPRVAGENPRLLLQIFFLTRQ
jgi:hypothetical protein